MAIASKQPPKPYQRKQNGLHHRHSKHYVKTYWPYLPLLFIISAGILANAWLPLSSTSSFQDSAWHSTPLFETSLASAALAVFLLRHAFSWHKVWVKGEAFVIHHPWLDNLLVAFAIVVLIFAHHNVVLF